MLPRIDKTLYVVGDRFAGFAAHDDVRTLGGLSAEIRAGAYDDLYLELRGGQGMGAYEWRYLEEQMNRRGIRERVVVHHSRPTPAHRAEAHKHREPNVLVANLGRRDDQLFEATMRLHGDNELLLDHQTGLHVQGMVAVEASRQMFLAVTERYYTADEPVSRYFVIESIATDFENFLFPMQARILYLIQSAELEDPERLRFTARIDIEQAGRRCTRTEVAFTAFDAERLKEIERRRAARALDHVLAVPDEQLTVAGGVR
ncbi:AfsA-related hotdog domain-containing protein [Nocardiopsis sp. CC223A]|uniref:AfsA-related hotdog domain-containing protein n=1 Tax=Nocardiopsis sp. CC223A TaxID=3044051 RepID=UPI00278C68C6|nr:AfsA-related hotdog domain-containing protein [Nocardiopsis sp. CC223A]